MTLSALDSMPGRITFFQPLTEADLSTLAEWLTRPHIAQWWGDFRSLEEVREQCLPHSGDDSGFVSYLAYQDGARIGYIQSYVAISAGGGWWPEEHHPGVRGIDQFLADGQRLGNGLGTEMVRQFVEVLFEDPAVPAFKPILRQPTCEQFVAMRRPAFVRWYRSPRRLELQF